MEPFLFNIYVNDLPDCVSFENVVMYANDVRLSVSGNYTATCDQLVSHLVRVFNWSDIWQIKMNISKCGDMHIDYSSSLHEYAMEKRVMSIYLTMSKIWG